MRSLRGLETSVLDSFAVVALLFKERGYDVVQVLFEWADSESQRHLISAVNWAEVSYIVEHKAGKGSWPQAKQVLAGLPLDIVPADRELAELAGEFKLKGKMSLGDCFAAALAKRHNMPLYTGDPRAPRYGA